MHNNYDQFKKELLYKSMLTSLLLKFIKYYLHRKDKNVCSHLSSKLFILLYFVQRNYIYI
jgi:hypothetical protein